MSAPISYAIGHVEAAMCSFGMTKSIVEHHICNAVAVFILDSEREGMISPELVEALLKRNSLSRPAGWESP